MTTKKPLFYTYTNEYLRYIPLQREMSGNTEKAYADALSLFRRYVLEVHGLGVDKLAFDHLDSDFMNNELSEHSHIEAGKRVDRKYGTSG